MNVHDFIDYRMEKTASKRHIAMDMGKDTLLSLVGKKGKTKRAVEASKNELKQMRDVLRDPNMNRFEKDLRSAGALLDTPLLKRVETLKDRKPGFTRKALMAKLKRN